MCTKMLLLLCPLISTFANSASTFDQRQTGDLNVQVDLKDLRIIALMKDTKEEYVDYDYAYDYSEMTIKPQNGTTPKPLNNSSTATETDNSTATGLIIEQTTLPIKSNISQIPVTTEVAWHQAVNDSTTTVKTLEPVTVTTETPDTMNNKNETSNGTHCRKGYVANKKGECELKLQGAGNALLKLVKLSQKLKLRREDRRNQGAETIIKSSIL